MSEVESGEPCIHACAWGCGRKYDIVLVQVVDSSTLMLCIPCMLSFSRNVMEAMVEANSDGVKEVVAGADMTDVMLVRSTASNPGMRGFSDPDATDDFFTTEGP